MPGVHSISVSSNPMRRSQGQAPGISAKSISFRKEFVPKRVMAISDVGWSRVL